MTDRTYEDGVRDGKLQALEHRQGIAEMRLDAHAQRLQKIERLIWGAYGVIATFQFVPDILELAKKALP